MAKIRTLLGAAVLLTSVVVPLLGTGAVHAQHGGDDPCPQRVENLPGCQ